MKNKSIGPSRNDTRKAKYATDPGTGDAIRAQSRENYHQQATGSRPPSRLTNGLLTRGDVREVIAGEMDAPEAVETFTIPQAAEALGRGVATLRRWIESDRVPAPYLTDTQHHYKVFSVGELEVIARVIARHEQEFVYLATGHSTVVETLQQAVHAYRAEYL